MAARWRGPPNLLIGPMSGPPQLSWLFQVILMMPEHHFSLLTTFQTLTRIGALLLGSWLLADKSPSKSSKLDPWLTPNNGSYRRPTFSTRTASTMTKKQKASSGPRQPLLLSLQPSPSGCSSPLARGTQGRRPLRAPQALRMTGCMRLIRCLCEQRAEACWFGTCTKLEAVREMHWHPQLHLTRAASFRGFMRCAPAQCLCERMISIYWWQVSLTEAWQHGTWPTAAGYGLPGTKTTTRVLSSGCGSYGVPPHGAPCLQQAMGL